MKQMHPNLRAIEAIDVMRYYVTYRDVEAKIIEAIDSGDDKEQEAAINFYMAKHMKIARNFGAGKGSVVLKKTIEYVNDGKRDVSALSVEFHKAEILSGENKNAIVAASKLLWLLDHKVIIMDGTAREVLEMPDNSSYDEFVDCWKKHYAIAEPVIADIIGKYSFAAIDSVMEQDWFKMRVFDQYLVSHRFAYFS
jgi:hypothetical protein